MTRITLDRKGRIRESEASVQKRIVAYLEAHGFLVFQNRSRSTGKLAAILTRDATGSPDLFVWGKPPHNETAKRYTYFFGSGLAPIHFAIEVKRKGGKPSQAQLDWAARYTGLGHLLIVASDTDIIERTLKDRGWL